MQVGALQSRWQHCTRSGARVDRCTWHHKNSMAHMRATHDSGMITYLGCACRCTTSTVSILIRAKWFARSCYAYGVTYLRVQSCVSRWAWNSDPAQRGTISSLSHNNHLAVSVHCVACCHIASHAYTTEQGISAARTKALWDSENPPAMANTVYVTWSCLTVLYTV